MNEALEKAFFLFVFVIVVVVQEVHDLVAIIGCPAIVVHHAEEHRLTVADVGLEVWADRLTEFSGLHTEVFGDPRMGMLIKIDPVDGKFDFQTFGITLIAPVRGLSILRNVRSSFHSSGSLSDSTLSAGFQGF